MGATYSKSIFNKYCEHCNEKYKVRTMNGGCHAMCIIWYEDHVCKCGSKNCVGFIVREGSRWRIKKQR